MFKHILVPTDGSPMSEAAVASAILFAKSVDARITGLSVVPPLQLSGESEMVVGNREQAEKIALDRARQHLEVIATSAQKAGVICDFVVEKSLHPWEAIIEAAAKRSCDLILMASHGRRGIKGLLLGSETQKVLTHTKIPVLVFR